MVFTSRGCETIKGDIYGEMVTEMASKAEVRERVTYSKLTISWSVPDCLTHPSLI